MIRPSFAAVPGPHQESVWDYPRPPALRRVTARVRIEFAGSVIADTERAWQVLETSHPPTYYLPMDAIAPGCLVPAQGQSYCEWKGNAVYWSVRVGERIAPRCGWSYPSPTSPFAAIKDHVAFYASAMDACWVGDERVQPQPGGFYGGWITSRVVGPFKGEPGTQSW